MGDLRIVAVGGLAVCLLWAPSSAYADVSLPRQVATAQPGDVITLPTGVTLLKRPLEIPSGVTVQGAKSGKSVLRIDTRRIHRFAYNFAVRPLDDARAVTVRNLTIDGGLTAGEELPLNHGGGLKAGSKWTVTKVTFTNINYFKLWLYEVSGTTVQGNTFTATPGVAGENDNIGGGRSRNLLIRNNVFSGTSTGSAIDILRSTRLTVRGNTLWGTAGNEKSMFLEGVTNSTVSDNAVAYGSITVKSDRGYSAYGELTNPLGVTVSDNVVTSSPGSAISVVYSNAKRGATAGGLNTVQNNTIVDAGRTGILALHCAPTADLPDVITGNTVTGAFTLGGSWQTGCGTVGPSGIAVTGGEGTTVSENTISDTQGTLAAGIWFGTADGDIPLKAPVEILNSTSPGLPTSHVVTR